jgi:alcohol-forming fatty acyl-CoA reductase
MYLLYLRQFDIVLCRVKMREIFIEKSFASKSVLVTGATGFIGKVLVEKLLRECKEINKIYILLRPKKSEELAKRFENFKNLIVFEHVKKSSNVLEKLIPVEADLMISPFAGISEENISKLKKDVNFVFHCAASVKFDEPLKNAIKMNTISTRNMLDLAEKFDNFEAFVHVSTAFSNTNQKAIYEKIYEPIYDYKTAIALTEMDANDKLDELNEFAMKTFPNTYVFSKNLTEKLVEDRSKTLPISIVRPSIVCPSFEEPFPGWVDSINGPMGVLIGASSGFLRTVHGDGNIVPDLIPCDFVVNTIIAAGASVASSENKDLKIYNCTSSKQLPITWNQFLDLSRIVYKDFPSTKVIWFPGGRMLSNYTLYLIYFTVFQLLPACFIDVCLLIAGKKIWAVKLQKRIFDSLKVFDYFLSKSWEWDNKNFELLHQLITLNER